ncbi:unnamed protein product [Camellia sinensis]
MKMSTITHTLQHEEGDDINIYIRPSSYREDKRSMALIINHITSSSFTLLFLLMLLWLTNTSAYQYTKNRWELLLNKLYSIECRNSSSSSDYSGGTPYFTSIGLEVLNISLSGNYVRVNHPVMSPNCPVINNGSSSVNLTNTPFQFSAYNNLFVAVGVGCDNQETMMLTDLLDNKKKMQITQCTLTCYSSTNIISSCASASSVQCLQGYKVNLACIGNNNNQSAGVGVVQTSCAYGFLGQYPAIPITNMLDELTTGVLNKTTTHVPVLLDWIFPAWNTTVTTPTSDILHRILFLHLTGGAKLLKAGHAIAIFPPREILTFRIDVKKRNHPQYCPESSGTFYLPQIRYHLKCYWSCLNHALDLVTSHYASFYHASSF